MTGWRNHLLDFATMLVCTTFAAPVQGQCDAFCRGWRQVWEARKDDFRSIQRDEKAHHGEFSVNVSLPGASKCYVLIDSDGEGTYWCKWSFDSQSEASLAYEDMKKNISINLPSNWKTTEKSNGYYKYFDLWGPDKLKYGGLIFDLDPSYAAFSFAITGHIRDSD